MFRNGRPILLILTLLIMSVPLLTVAAQEGESSSLIPHLTELADETVTRLEQMARRDSAARVVQTGNILYRDEPTPLGQTFAAMVTTRIANLNNPKLIAMAPSPRDSRDNESGEALSPDIIISGVAFEDGNQLLLSIQMIQLSNQRILGGIEKNLRLTEALEDSLRSVRANLAMGSDQYEPDNTFGDANTIESVTVENGHTLMPGGDVDWYEITLPADFSSFPGAEGGAALFQMVVKTEGGTDTRLSLYGPDDPNLFIIENDDAQDSNAQVTTLVQPGETYWAAVSGYGSDTTGPYILNSRVMIAQTDSYEPNNSQDTATMITPSTPPQEHSLSPAGDEDWFQVNLEEPTEPYILQLATGSDIDTFMELYDQYGNMIQSDDDSAGNGNARINLTVEKTGTYYLKVRGYDTSTQGDYTLSALRTILQVDEYEPDDTMAQATLLDPQGPPQNHTFVDSNDIDWLRLDIEVASQLSLETSGDVDTYLTLYNAQGSMILSDDDTGPDVNALIQETLQPGVYFIKVNPVSDNLINAPYSIHSSLY